MTTTLWEHAARAFEPPTRRWPRPVDLARAVDPVDAGVQTPALQLLDDVLDDVEAGRCDRVIISMPPQEGKALALYTPIATPSGWTTMGELAVGDQVFDRHGRPCRVTWTSPTWNGRPCYQVTTGDGERIIADAAHEWVARLTRRGPQQVIETTVLAKTRGKNAQIMAGAALDLPEADLPLDPYVLGAWLGDGHSEAATITLADLEIVQRIRAAGVPCDKTPAKYQWSLAGDRKDRLPGQGRCSRIRRALTDLGVWGDKHVPAAYLRASRAQRLALLQGLVDTDGYVMPKGQVEFCSTNLRLAEGVRELVYSLGAKAVLGVGRATIDGRDCGAKYRVRFYLAEAAHLPRKAARCKDSSVGALRYVSAEAVESVPVRCIEVDSPDHTYLAGRTMLPTHNSTRITKIGALWFLACNPERRIGIVAYAQDLADEFSTAIRGHILNNDGDEGSLDLGMRLAPDQAAVRRWRLDGHRGGIRAVGLTGGLTGRPLDALFIDDPISNAEQAHSPTYRDRAWNFWQSVGSTRLAPGAPVILVLTRWHESDLAGRLLREEPGRWRVVSIPAIAESNDDPLGRAPGQEMESARGREAGYFHDLKTIRDQYTFSALYQQRPTPAEGGLFKRSGLRYWKPAGPNELGNAIDLHRRVWLRDTYRFATVDTASSVRTSADWTVISIWAHTSDDHLVLLDRARARVEVTRHWEIARPLIEKWQPDWVGVEDATRAMTLVSDLTANNVRWKALIASTDKITRALPAAARVEQGRVWLPAEASWLHEFEGELLQFPNAAHDDQVDCLSYAALEVARGRMSPGVVSVPARRAERVDADLAPTPDLDLMAEAY